MALSATSHLTNTAKGLECDDEVKHAKVLSSFRINEVEETASSVASDRFLYCRYKYLKAGKYNTLTDCRVERLEIGCLGTISGDKSVYGSILGKGGVTLKGGVVVEGSASFMDDPEVDGVTIRGMLSWTICNGDGNEIKNSTIGSMHILPEGAYSTKVIESTKEERELECFEGEVVISVDPAEVKVIQKPRCCTRTWFIYIAKMICDFFRKLFNYKKNTKDPVKSLDVSPKVQKKRSSRPQDEVVDHGDPRTLILKNTVVEGDITYSGAHLNVVLEGKSKVKGRIYRAEVS